MSPICLLTVWYVSGRGAANTGVKFSGALFCWPPNFPLELTQCPILVRMVGQGIWFCTTYEVTAHLEQQEQLDSWFVALLCQEVSLTARL